MTNVYEGPIKCKGQRDEEVRLVTTEHLQELLDLRQAEMAPKRANIGHLPLSIDDKQRANLRQLVAYLKKNIDKITLYMAGFNQHEPYVADRHKCDTVACLCGYGPLAGLKGRIDENWGRYSDRVFSGNDGYLFDWCFGGTWGDRDNTVKDGIARIEYALAYGIPKNYNEQSKGEEELCYETL